MEERTHTPHYWLLFSECFGPTFRLIHWFPLRVPSGVVRTNLPEQLIYSWSNRLLYLAPSRTIFNMRGPFLRIPKEGLVQTVCQAAFGGRQYMISEFETCNVSTKQLSFHSNLVTGGALVHLLSLNTEDGRVCSVLFLLNLADFLTHLPNLRRICGIASYPSPRFQMAADTPEQILVVDKILTHFVFVHVLVQSLLASSC